jgi:hypothetical protein
MSYQSAAALQAAVFASLSADAGLAALIGTAIHDAPPPGTPPGTYVVLGTEEAFDRSDVTGAGAEHALTISVLSDAAGFVTAKTVAGRVCTVMAAPLPPLAVGRLVAVWFDRATARRLEGGQTQRIDLRFRARIEG